MEHVSRLCQSEGKKDYRVKKIKKQGTDNKAVLFHFPNALRKWMSDRKTEFHPYEFEKQGAIEQLYSGYMENMLDTTYNAYRRSYFKPEARAETYIPQYEIEFVKYLKQITEKLERISNFNATVSSYLINDSSKKCFTLSTYFTMRIDIGLRKTK